MVIPKRPSFKSGERLQATYQPGDKVRILHGKYEGRIMTVRECTSDEVWLVETPKRESMSKGNLERVI